MSTEPQRPIEKLLRDAAQKRREQAGAPFELHPATRKMLQGEVARQFRPGGGRAEPSGFLQRLRQLWPRVAWSFGALTIVGLIAWLLFPAATKSGKEALLAKSEGIKHGETTPTAVPEAAVASAPSEGDRQKQLPARTPAEMPGAARDESVPVQHETLLADSEKAKVAAEPQPTTSARAAKTVDNLQEPSADEKVLKFSNRISGGSSSAAPAASVNAAVAPPPAAASSAAVPKNEAVADGNRTTFAFNTPALSEAQKDEFRKQLAAQTTAPTSAALTESRTVSADKIPEISGTSTNAVHPAEVAQSFRRLDEIGKGDLSLQDGRVPAQIVLASFQVKQTGQEIQIIDQDNSVYTGSVLPAGDLLKSALAAKKAQAPPSSRAVGLYSDSSLQNVTNTASLQGLAFRVTGTNSSLNQRVVFSGNLIWVGLTNAGFSGKMQIAGGAVGGLGGGGGASGSAVPTASHVSGKVRIGDGQEFEIEAVYAKP
jgi:hypothetical protein